MNSKKNRSYRNDVSFIVLFWLLLNGISQQQNAFLNHYFRVVIFCNILNILPQN